MASAHPTSAPLTSTKSELVTTAADPVVDWPQRHVPQPSNSVQVRAPPLATSASNHVDPAAMRIGSADEDEILFVKEFIPGQRYYGVDDHVEYLAGNVPLILSVPHGGYAAPECIPHRNGGCHEPDIATQELAREVIRAIQVEMSSHRTSTDNATLPPSPFVIINRLQRAKLDMNRNEMDASGGHTHTRLVWRQYHAFIRRAKREIIRGKSITTKPLQNSTDGMAPSVDSFPSHRYSRGLFLDLHGQSHDHRHQIGYVLNQQELATNSDDQLDKDEMLKEKCSLRSAITMQPGQCHQSNGSTSAPPSSHVGYATVASAAGPVLLSSIVRGSESLGGLLERIGGVTAACVPSPSSPDAQPYSLTYFNGGYNTCVHGGSILGERQRAKERKRKTDERAATTSVEVASKRIIADPDPYFTQAFHSHLERDCFLSMQLETAYQHCRDSEESMRTFSTHLARALCIFMRRHVLRLGGTMPGEKETSSVDER